MAKGKGSIRNLESLLAEGVGRGPGGFSSETVNGTANYEGLGWNRLETYTPMPSKAGGPWKKGSNRTGE